MALPLSGRRCFNQIVNMTSGTYSGSVNSLKALPSRPLACRPTTQIRSLSVFSTGSIRDRTIYSPSCPPCSDTIPQHPLSRRVRGGTSGHASIIVLTVGPAWQGQRDRSAIRACNAARKYPPQGSRPAARHESCCPKVSG